MTIHLQEPIVVGVDGTEESQVAVRFAALEARRNGCGLRLVHAMPETVPMAPMLPLISVETLDQVGHRIVNGAKQLAYDVVDGDLQVEGVVRPGSRVRVVLAAAEDARMVVLGRRDRSLLGRVFTGSTCAGVAPRSRCPVVSVPNGWAPEDPSGPVVVGVKDARSSRDALAAGFALAAQRGTRLVVLHAWKLPSGYDDIVVSRDAVDEWIASAKTMVEDLLDDWRGSYPEVNVEIDLRHEYPAPALVAASERAGLLVLGRHGQHTPWGMRLGSKAHALLRESRCPVLIALPQPTEEPLPSRPYMTADEYAPQA